MSCGCGCGNGGCSHGSSSAKSAGGAIQNGKGDAPRNISAEFRKNFDGIRWSAKKAVKPGKKFVKTY